MRTTRQESMGLSKHRRKSRTPAVWLIKVPSWKQSNCPLTEKCMGIRSLEHSMPMEMCELELCADTDVEQKKRFTKEYLQSGSSEIQFKTSQTLFYRDAILSAKNMKKSKDNL